MSDTMPESHGTVPESPGTETAVAGEALPVTPADILVAESSSGELLAGVVPEGMASVPDATATSVADAQEGVTLNLGDVLPGAADVTDPGLGAWLTFETSGGNTVISIDAGGAGEAGAVPVVTLEGVTGLTLQQLLNYNPDVT